MNQGKENHKSLIEDAIMYLKTEGYNNDEIFTEYKVMTEIRNGDTMSYTCYVDVVGKKGDDLLMIECGNCSEDRKEALETIGKVLFFPYKKRVAKCVNIFQYQQDFIEGERKTFSFSRFIQAKLDEYIKYRKDCKKIMEDINLGESL